MGGFYSEMEDHGQATSSAQGSVHEILVFETYETLPLKTQLKSFLCYLLFSCKKLNIIKKYKKHSVKI